MLKLPVGGYFLTGGVGILSYGVVKLPLKTHLIV